MYTEKPTSAQSWSSFQRGHRRAARQAHGPRYSWQPVIFPREAKRNTTAAAAARTASAGSIIAIACRAGRPAMGGSTSPTLKTTASTAPSSGSSEPPMTVVLPATYWG